MNMDFEEFSVPIPSCFFSTELGTPFSTCAMCSAHLRNSGINYFVEKYYRDKNIAFEYAICENCKSQMSDEISSESLNNINNYFIENVNIEKRVDLLANFDNSIVPWISNCLFKSKPRSECSEYQLAAQCRNDQLIVSILPFMVSNDATEEIQSILSKKTKENFKRFKDKLNPPVNLNDLILT